MQIPGPHSRMTESCSLEEWPGAVHLTSSPGAPWTCRWLKTIALSDRFSWKPVMSLDTMCPEILCTPGGLVHGTLYPTGLG